MTLFSFVIIAIVLMVFYSQKSIKKIFNSLFAFSVTLEIMVSVGYFIRIGTFEIGYSEFLIVIEAIIAFYLLLSGQKPKRTQIQAGLLLIGSCILSLVLQCIYPYQGSVVSYEAQWDLVYFEGAKIAPIKISLTQIKELVHLFCYMLIMWVMYSYDHKSIAETMSNIFKHCTFFIWFAVFEFITVNFLKLQKQLYSLESTILGDSFFNNAGIVSLGVTNRLRGLKSEPSMFGYALFLFIILAVALYLAEKKRVYFRYAIIAIFLQLASLSLTITICIVCFLFFYYCYKLITGNTLTKILTTFTICMVLLLIILGTSYLYVNDFSNYYLHRIHLALSNWNNLGMTWSGDFKNHDGSTMIRLISIVGEFKYFIKRPLFGLALGSTYAHSPFMTILASIGLVGTYFWYKFVFYMPFKGSAANTAMKICWCIMLIFAGAGLFPFYGVQNIILYYSLIIINNPDSRYASARACRERAASIRGSEYRINR